MFISSRYKKYTCMISTLLCIASHQPTYADNTNYILAAKKVTLLRNLDRISDTVANANTTSFKAENDVFTESTKRTSQRENLSFQTIGTTVRDNSQGGMSSTGRQLDVAINGNGYFMVTTPYGQMYTRNGSFNVSKEGILVTQDGYPVSGPSGGQVELNEKDVDISIKEDGLVKSGEEERGQVGVFMFENINLLERMGKGLYSTKQTPKIADSYKVAQGMLENSNVNSVTAMTNLVAISREFESVAKLSESNNDMQLNMIRKMSQ